MSRLLKIRKSHGKQAIADLHHARPPAAFRGWPLLAEEKCPANCRDCLDICASHALASHPLTIDLGKCLFCGECQRVCPAGAIRFDNTHRLAAGMREHLHVTSGISAVQYAHETIPLRREIRKLFGRSLKLRSVSAGGCNACEMELNACGNVNFDMGRFGIEVVASPRHADGLIITGPVPENMASALEDTFRAIPDPVLVIAAGACAISGGIFASSPALERSFFSRHPVDLFIPGCPFHPLTLIDGLLHLLGIAAPTKMK